MNIQYLQIILYFCISVQTETSCFTKNSLNVFLFKSLCLSQRLIVLP